MEKGILLATPDLRPSLMSLLKGLDDEGLLKRVVTTIGIDTETVIGGLIVSLSKVMPANINGLLERRILPDYLKGKTQSIYLREVLRLLASKMLSRIMAHKVWLWAELGFDQKVAKIYLGRYSCIYGMEHSSLEAFRRQKELGGLCILRQVMAHGRVAIEVIKNQENAWPQYCQKDSAYFLADMQRALVRKEEEYRLADLVVANSVFVKDSFVRSGIQADKVVVIPTGCPRIASVRVRPGSGNRPLIFLYVGRLSLRKGLPYLLEAWQRLEVKGSAELWLAGASEIPAVVFKKNNGIRYFGALTGPKLEKVYKEADVFVFPTLLEGLAHAVLEALSNGLPIITTKESGSEGFVQNGNNGFIVEAGSVSSLYTAMEWCLKHPDALPEMGKVSFEKARSWSVEDSNHRHLAVIKEFLGKQGNL